MKKVNISSLVVLLSISGLSSAQTAEKPPNILFIITDNEPSSTQGCYGNDEISTPNIDRLAKEGMLFQNCFATNGMCSPTRSSILTGLMPCQHGVATALCDSPRNKFWPPNWGAIDEFRTLPQTLADAGYDTALIGKFHIGSPYAPKLKFKDWVTFTVGETSQWFDNEVIDNGKTYIEHGNICKFWTKKAIEYLNKHDRSKPFFLYLAYNGPYGLPPVILKPPGNDFAKLYADKTLKCLPQKPINPDLLDPLLDLQTQLDNPFLKWVSDYFKDLISCLNNQIVMRNFASQISFVDNEIGQVLAALKENGLDENTLVIFTSDQGCAYGQKGLWGQSNNSLPANLYENTIKIPFIISHAKHIEPLQQTDIMVSEYDFFSTILDYVGLSKIKISNTPGQSFAPLLRDEPLDWSKQDAIFMEQEATRAIRTQEWKYVKFFEQKREELYNMIDDPEENNNLADQPKFAKIKMALNQRLDAFFKKYANPQYDLWQNGTVKSNSDLENIWSKRYPNWTPVTKLAKPFSEK